LEESRHEVADHEHNIADADCHGGEKKTWETRAHTEAERSR
jgi:hypothetical protein